MAASNSEKAQLLDGAPLCAVVIDECGLAVACNTLFEQLMGPLYKFANFPFVHAAATDSGQAALKRAVALVSMGVSSRERVRNLEMTTLAGDAGLPIKSHFDWFVGGGASEDGVAPVTLFGDPCSDDILEQREKDAELIDFFQNAPIALHWLSGTGHVMWANQTELDVLGYTAEEYIGQPIMKFCPDEEELVLEIFKALGSGNTIKDVPVRFRTKCGKIVPLLIDSNVAYKVDAQGEQQFNHTRCFIRDDTGRRVREARAAAMASESERSLKLLDAFVSRTLHLVKTPCHVVQQSLGIIAANVETLLARLPPSTASMVDETKMLVDRSIALLCSTSELIRDASDLMRFDNGAAMHTVSASVDLVAFGRRQVDLALPLVAKPRVRVAFEFGGGASIALLDEVVLGRALTQLLKNAVAATPEGGCITLRIGQQPHHDGVERILFEVHDTGCGLEVGAAASSVFARYSSGHFLAPADSPASTDTDSQASTGKVPPTPTQFETARLGFEKSLSFSSKHTTGLGIGLNLAYNLVRALGGELRVASEEGDTSFSFVLAVEGGSARIAAEAYELISASPKESSRTRCRSEESCAAALGWGRGSRQHSDTDTATGTGTSPSDSVGSSSHSLSSTLSSLTCRTPKHDPAIGPHFPPPESIRRFAAPPSSKKLVGAPEIAGRGLKALDAPHVLVVEDTEMCAVVLSSMLHKLGCSSEHAKDGAVAVAMLERAEPGLYAVILMDLRMPTMDGFEATRVIKQELRLHTPVIALTADDAFDTRKRCMEIGFADFATKPLLYHSLAKLVEKHTGHKVEEAA